MPRTFEYKFIRVTLSDGLLKPFGVRYRDEIERQASQGWRFVQAFSSPVERASVECDLIFEREKP